MSPEAISGLMELVGDLAVPAFTIAFVFAFVGKMVKTLLNMMFDGKFKL